MVTAFLTAYLISVDCVFISVDSPWTSFRVTQHLMVTAYLTGVDGPWTSFRTTQSLRVTACLESEDLVQSDLIFADDCIPEVLGLHSERPNRCR